MFGLLNINKPSGITSRTAVDRVARLVRGTKIGHAGTLDPIAEGVLVICLGRATRLVPFLHQVPKRYLATYLLGRTSSTDDIEGDVIPADTDRVPSGVEIRQTVDRFVGEVAQRPPAFSAVKVKGKRAYTLARQGMHVQLEPKLVTIHWIEIVTYCYPRLILDVTCGTGTYLRSLGRDLGTTLAVGAVMSELRRTAIGPFHIDAACDLNMLTVETLPAELQPAIRAVEHLPRVGLTARQVTAVGHGQRIDGPKMASRPQVAAVDDNGQLVAILQAEENGRFKPIRVFIRGG